ncbi:hypothetical protein J6590_056620 [Homalodisca vitripennis]|nr:hypothetical protein J6590_056620 [Homalodisca vitripennis]
MGKASKGWDVPEPGRFWRLGRSRGWEVLEAERDQSPRAVTGRNLTKSLSQRKNPKIKGNMKTENPQNTEAKSAFQLVS